MFAAVFDGKLDQVNADILTPGTHLGIESHDALFFNTEKICAVKSSRKRGFGINDNPHTPWPGVLLSLLTW